MLIPVSDPGDPRLAPFRDLKDNVRARDGGFLVEGAIALEQLAKASRFPPRAILIAESRVAPLNAVLARLPDHAPVYVAPQAVLDGVAGLHLHRGVLALADRIAPPTPQQLLPAEGALLCLALVELANTDNVGACFRNAAAFGADAILLDAACCDPLYRKAIRVSSGHALSLPFAVSSSADAMFDTLDALDVETWALTPSGGEALHTLAPPARLALALGAEGPGLPAHVMNRARKVSIPMAGGVDSLNVATAAAVALAHVFANRS